MERDPEDVKRKNIEVEKESRINGSPFLGIYQFIEAFIYFLRTGLNTDEMYKIKPAIPIPAIMLKDWPV